MIKNYPATIWLQIFRLLPVSDLLMSKLVCKEWYSIINSRSVNKNTAVKFQNQRLFNIGFSDMLRSAKNFLTCLELKGVNLDNEILRSDSSNELLSALYSLTLLNCSTSDSKYLVSILKQCSSLKSLHLNYLENVQKMDNFLALEEDRIEVKTSLQHVTELDLNFHNLFSNLSFNRLVECMSNIDSLEVIGFNPHITDTYEKFMPLYNSLKAFITKRAEKIKHLKIAELYASYKENGIDVYRSPDYLLDLAAIPNLKLKTATISMRYGEKYESLTHFLSKHNLQKLDIQNFIASQNTTRQLFKAIRSVNVLALKGSPFPIENTFSSLDNLNSLTVTVTDCDYWHDFVKELRKSKCYTSLQKLTFHSSKRRIEGASEIFDEASEIFDEAINIKYLSLGSRIVDMVGICAENENYMSKVLFKLKRLISLTLSSTLTNCDFLINKNNFTGSFKNVLQAFLKENKIFQSSENTEMDLDQINLFCSKHCHPEYLNIFCPIEALHFHLTNVEDIFFMAINFQHLRYVHLFACCRLTDHGVIALGAKNPNLEKIFLEYSNITSMGLFGMLRATRRLTDLRILNCWNISKVEVYEKLPYICKYLKNFLIHDDLFVYHVIENELKEDHPLWLATERGVAEYKLRVFRTHHLHR